MSDILARYGLKRIDPMTLPRATREAIFHTARTHTTMVLGHGSNPYSFHGSGAVLKIICDSTGAIVELPSTMDGMPLERYEKCRFCGWEFYPDKVIDAEPTEILVETDHIDAWPALPWWPE